ncbi:MAG: feruloyl-CoA synthase [Pseudonocardiaceae bacterium]
MYDQPFALPDVVRENRDDGSVLLRSRVPLGDTPRNMADVFVDGARRHPDRVLVAERVAGGWRSVTWGEAANGVAGIAQGLIDRGVGGRPVMILSGNSVDHLLLCLAAFSVASPVAATSVAYSMQTSDHAKLRAMAETVEPALVYAEDSGAFAAAIDAVLDVAPDAMLVSEGGRGEALGDLAETVATGAVAARQAAVGPDDVAKYLFTSGSTGRPKAVITTHRMLTANQQAMRQVWPFLNDQPPVLLDWLPWSHTFGGSHNVGMVLYGGGSLYIDDGRPTPELIQRTLANLAEVSPTIYFNVPVGYSLLVPRLRSEPELARRFFRKLRVVFFAAAALPQTLWDQLGQLAADHATAPVAVTTAWGTTETAPAATVAHFASDVPTCIGVPLPGLEAKLAPTAGKYEIRVRGPHITPGYRRRPDLNEQAFDSEGFYRTGDAVSLVDPDRPERGLLFDGRLAEDFKLDTGTWVNVAGVKASLLSSSAGLLQDCVVCGHDRSYVAAMAWLNPVVAAEVAGEQSGTATDLVDHPAVRMHLASALAKANEGVGSSARVARLLLLHEPPQLDAGEITDKGYVNQRACLERRADRVVDVFRDPPEAELIVPDEAALRTP